MLESVEPENSIYKIKKECLSKNKKIRSRHAIETAVRGCS